MPAGAVEPAGVTLHEVDEDLATPLESVPLSFERFDPVTFTASFLPPEDGLAAPTWFGGAHPDGGEALTAVAYFSMEFGLNEALPIYSGGLGVLAGDHLKAASDLGVPIVGVGLLYRSGYFAQSLSREGWQQERYPVLDPDGLYVWWYGAGNPVNFMGFDDPEVNALLDQGRENPDPTARQQIYADLNRELAKENYMLWASWTIWAIPMQPEFHNVVGAQPPDYSKSPYTGLALGHDLALLWKEQ